MTSIDNDLIDRQRTELLELGFHQRHGFLYVYDLPTRRVECSIRTDDRWLVTVSPEGGRRTDIADEMLLSPGIALPTFVAVVGSLL